MSELELKFQVPPAARAALLKAIGHRRLQRLALDARYVDTADHLLARHRMALRLRCENGRWVQTLKASMGHGLERFEHEVVLEGEADPGLPEPRRHAGTDVGDALARLLRRHGEPQLAELYRVEVVRLHRTLAYGDALVEWSLDEGRIVAGEHVREISELELELKSGDPQSLYAMGYDWQARHGVWLDVVSKAERGTLLTAGRTFVAAVKSVPPAVDRHQDGPALLRAIVSACLAQILPNAGELAAGSESPEHVHQLRVGLRRLRTAVREFGQFAPGMAEVVEAEVTRVFDVLGESRDRHVRDSDLAALLEQAGAPLVRLHEPALPSLSPAVRAAGFQGVLLRLLAYAHGGGESDPLVPPADVHRLVRERLEHLHRRLRRARRRFDELDVEERHRVRRQLKRLRYLAGFVAPLFKESRVKPWILAAAPAQDALGAWVDLEFAAGHFEAGAAADPRAWFAAGWLRARQPEAVRAGAKALRQFLETDVFW